MNAAKAPRMLLAAAALMTGVTAGMGCASRATSFDTGVETERAALRVRNDNWHDVRIYIATEFGQATVRVATVPASSSAVIRLRGRVLHEIRTRGTVRFLIRPLGSRASYTTHAVLVGPGDEMRLNVSNQLSLTTLYIGSRY